MTWVVECRDPETLKVVEFREFKEKGEAMIEVIRLVVNDPKLECVIKKTRK